MPIITLENEEVANSVGVIVNHIIKTERDLKDCRNELCLRCGQYKTAHLGSCDECRWRADIHG